MRKTAPSPPQLEQHPVDEPVVRRVVLVGVVVGLVHEHQVQPHVPVPVVHVAVQLPADRAGAEEHDPRLHVQVLLAGVDESFHGLR